MGSDCFCSKPQLILTYRFKPSYHHTIPSWHTLCVFQNFQLAVGKNTLANPKIQRENWRGNLIKAYCHIRFSQLNAVTRSGVKRHCVWDRNKQNLEPWEKSAKTPPKIATQSCKKEGRELSKVGTEWNTFLSSISDCISNTYILDVTLSTRIGNHQSLPGVPVWLRSLSVTPGSLLSLSHGRTTQKPSELEVENTKIHF